jgi:selenoprotein W-related protein
MGFVGSKPVISIEYCTVCNFRGRAAWLAQELLAAFEGDIEGVMLVPGRGGVLIVRIDGEVVFSNKEEGRFPEPRELKDALLVKLGLPPSPRHD